MLGMLTWIEGNPVLAALVAAVIGAIATIYTAYIMRSSPSEPTAETQPKLLRKSVWKRIPRRIEEHPAITGFLGAIGAALIGLFGLWYFATDPTTQPTAETQPSLIEKPVTLTITPAASSAARRILASQPINCDSINRSGPGMFGQSIFSLRDMLRDMRANSTNLEIQNMYQQFAGLVVMDCGYIRDIYKQPDAIPVYFDKSLEGLGGFNAVCVFKPSFESELISHKKAAERLAFVGVIVPHTVGAFTRILIAGCRLLQVETQPEPSGNAGVQSSPEPPAEVPVRPGPVATPSPPTSPHREPVNCDSINRSGRDVFGQSVFDLGDRVRDMIGNRTDLEIAEFRQSFEGLLVIDCGYVDNIYRTTGGLTVTLRKKQEEPAPVPTSCYFDESWKSKLVAQDRTKWVAFEGIIAPSPDRVIRLEDCRLLQEASRT